MVYFEVGNLSTETYPSSANLPTYVRENYRLGGSYGNSNIDRIIISYQVRTRVVGTVYVTEHDNASFGRFCPDRTYEVNSEVIMALNDPQLDLTDFLTQMGYYGDIQVVQENYIEDIYDLQPFVPQMLNGVQTYSQSTGRAEQSDNDFFSEAFNQYLHVDSDPISYYQQSNIRLNSQELRQYRRPKAKKKKQRPFRQYYWPSRWEQPYEGKGAVKNFCIHLTVFAFLLFKTVYILLLQGKITTSHIVCAFVLEDSYSYPTINKL